MPLEFRVGSTAGAFKRGLNFGFRLLCMLLDAHRPRESLGDQMYVGAACLRDYAIPRDGTSKIVLICDREHDLKREHVAIGPGFTLSTLAKAFLLRENSTRRRSNEYDPFPSLCRNTGSAACPMREPARHRTPRGRVASEKAGGSLRSYCHSRLPRAFPPSPVTPGDIGE